MIRDLNDAQWCFLDLLMRARQLGVTRVHRREILSSSTLSDAAKLQLTWAGLTMPDSLVRMVREHEFEITNAGVDLYNLRFGHGRNPAPTSVADAVICLPDLSVGREASA